MSVIVAPSILSADFAKLADEIQAVEAAGADWIHIDVMDGHFVPNITMGPLVVKAVRRATKLPLDVHLMITQPEQYVGAFADAGADWISIHAEATPHAHRCLQMIKKTGAHPAIALNPSTPLYHLDHLWDNTDMVLLMTVNPGFGGQSYIAQMTEKIQTLSKKIQRTGQNILIEVDGGMTQDNASEVQKAGVNIIVAGSAVFKTKDYGQAISSLRG